MTLVWAAGYNGVTDPDAQTYLAAVEAADGQALEGDVALAINDFVVGCKLDGIWDAIKASCILAGARTLSGALVPLKGTAPTNFNFVSGDYNRETGLVGDGSTKSLLSNRANNADPQNSKHLSAYISVAAGSTSQAIIAASGQVSGGSFWYMNASTLSNIVRINGTSNATVTTSVPGFTGFSRSTSTDVVMRASGATTTAAQTSSTPASDVHSIFTRTVSPSGFYSASRISFYSIGESLDLALLDNRVSTLMTDIGAAIP